MYDNELLYGFAKQKVQLCQMPGQMSVDTDGEKQKILNQKVFPKGFPFHTIKLTVVKCSKSLNETKVGVFSAPSLVLEW